MREFQFIVLISGCLMLQPLSTDLYLSSLPNIADDFGVPAILVQQTLVFFAIGFGIAQLVSGPMSDRYGRRPILLGGLLLYSIASLACALAPDIHFLIAMRFAQACGCCSVIVTARAMIRDSYSPTAGAQKLAQSSSYMAFAVVSGPIIGAQLQVGFGWHAAFLFLALLSLLLLTVAWRWTRMHEIPASPSAISGKLLPDYAAILVQPVFRAYALAGMLSYASIFVFISGSAFVLIQVLGVSTGNFGYCFAFGCTGYLSGSFLCRRLLAKLGVEKTICAGSLITAITGLSFLMISMLGLVTWWWMIAFQFCAMFAHGINFPCAQVGSLASFPSASGAAAGLFGALSVCGALVVSNLVGLMLDGTAHPLAQLASVIGITQALVVGIAYHKRILALS